ncbi:MAG: ABC transporter substrate-binding protein [bacterium]|nr:ABC transporter substrate-binding protein [bacterium]
MPNFAEELTVFINKIDVTINDFLRINKEFVANLIKINDVGFLETDILEDIVKALEEVANITLEISGVAEEITIESDDAFKSVEKGINSISYTVNNLSNINKLLDDFRSKFKNLTKQTLKIEEKSKNINNLSRAINQLSINASIKSLKAGDKGKGFAVIAENILELADNSIKVAEDINTMIKIIHTRSQEVSELTESIFQELTKSGEYSEEIQRDLRIIIELYNDLENLTKNINEAVEVQAQLKEVLRMKNEELKKIFDRIIFTSETATLKVDQQSIISKEIQNNLNALNEMTQNSIVWLSKFKTDTPIEYNYPCRNEPETLDPIFMRDLESGNITKMLYSGLMNFNASGMVKPALVESHFIFESGKSYLFNLRKDIFYHDGSRLTSRDVKLSLERFLNPQNLSTYGIIFSYVKGLAEFKSGAANEIKGFEIIDDLRFRISLDNPHNFLFEELATVQSLIVKINEKGEFVPNIGTGPFVFKEWKKGEELILEANEHFFLGKPPIDYLRIKFIPERKDQIKLFKTGELDHVFVNKSEKEELKEYGTSFSKDQHTICYLGFNLKTEGKTKEKDVRKAFSMILDREEVLKNLNYKPYNKIIPPTLLTKGRFDQASEINKELAQSLLEQAGVTPEDEFILDLPLDRIEMGERIKKQFEDSGIKLSLRSSPWKEYLDRLISGKTEMFLINFISDSTSFDSLFHSLFHSDSIGNADNDFRFSDKEIDRLIDEGTRKNFARHELEDYYIDLEARITNEYPMIILGYGEEVIMHQKIVKFIDINPLGEMMISNVWKEQEHVLSDESFNSEEVYNDIKNIDICMTKFQNIILENFVTLELIGNLFIGMKKKYEEQNDIFNEVHDSLQKFSTSLNKISSGKLQLSVEKEKIKILRVEVLDNLENVFGSLNNKFSDLNGILKVLEEDIFNISKKVRNLKQISKNTNNFSLYASIEAARTSGFEQELKEISREINTVAISSNQISNDIFSAISDIKLSIKIGFTSIENITSALLLSSGMFNTMRSMILDFENEFEQLFQPIKDVLDSIERQKELHRLLISKTLQMLSMIKGTQRAISNMEVSINELNIIGNDIHWDYLNCFEIYSWMKDLITKKVPEKEVKRILRTYSNSSALTFDPGFVTDSATNIIVKNLGDGLVDFSSGTEIIPSIARGWDVSEDGLEWTFYLRDNVFFHNGKSLTSRDVRFSFERLFDRRNDAYNWTFFSILEGCDYFRKGVIEYIKGIEIIDKYTIKFKLKRPYIPFLSNLATIAGLIVCREIENPVKKEDALKPLPMTGPFIVREIKENNDLILEANHDYFLGRPYFDEVHITVIRDSEEAERRFNEGEIDIFIPQSADFDKYLEDEKYRDSIVSTPSLDIKYLGFNTESETPFRYKEVRQACYHAINIPELVSKLLGKHAIPAKGVLPPGVKGYNKNLENYNYNLDKAKELLTRVRYSGGLPGTYPLYCSNRDIEIAKAEMIKGYLEQIGIDLEIVKLPWKDLIERCNEGSIVLFLMGWISDNGDPDNFFYPLFHSSNCGVHGNYTFFTNTEVDKVIENAMQIKNTTKRIEQYQKVEEMILSYAPAVFLHHQVDYLIANPKIRNANLHPLGLKKWSQMWKK